MRYIFLNPIKSDEDKKQAKELPVLPKEQLAKYIKDKTETKIITPGTKAVSRKKHEEFITNVTAEVLGLVKEKKHFLKNRISADILKETPIVFKDNGNSFMLNSLSSTVMDLYVVSRLREDKVRNAVLFKELADELKKKSANAPAEVQKFVKGLKSAEQYSKQELLDVLNKLAGFLLTFPGRLGPDASDLTRFGAETGEGTKTDQFDVGCNPVPNPKGLITNISWPLKPHITSVKNQRNRGTCTAFGAVGTVETSVSVKYGVKVNLSEQDLYKKQKLDWNPNIFDDYYDDGYFPPFGMLFQLVFGYVFPFEKDWTYNPSNSRIRNDAQHKMTMSCVGYNGLSCSDTNHQATKKCYKIRTTEVEEVVNEVCDFLEGIPFLGSFAGWACHTVTRVIEVVKETQVCIYETNVPGTSRFKTASFVLVWDPLFNTDIALAKYFLSQKKSLIFCFTVPDSWGTAQHSAADGNGYVVFNAKEATPKDAGGHCVQVIGHIDNDKIPAALNIAPGAGGGYFIVKNSWGRCFGDMGFAYLPYSWVDKWGTEMVAITNVEKV
jgi:hypothetical protein